MLISLRNVSKYYGGVVALKNLDLDVYKGEIHGIVGENGAGKSTLVKILTGVIRPEPGAEINIEGEIFSSLTPFLAYQKGIHVVHQDLSLFPNLTVLENITIHTYLKSFLVNTRKLRKMARVVLENLGINIDLNTRVGDLPLADQEIVAICRAIFGEAKLIILDEPTASLTSKDVSRLFEFMRELQKKGISFIFISHRLDEVLEICQRITVLRDGISVGTFAREEMNKEKLIELMIGKKLSKIQKERSSCGIDDEVILEVKNLSKHPEFSNISFTLRRGEILGIIGPRGSGRTEMALSLIGLNPPDFGEIWFEGKKIKIKDYKEAVNLGIFYIPENRLTQGLVLDQSLAYNIAITNLKKLSRRGYVSAKGIVDFARQAIEIFKIKSPSPVVPVRMLSGGNQQRVVLAKWILAAPKVLILDSPTAGVDVGAREAIYRLIHEIVQKGIGCIWISDEASEILNNCDRLLVMKHGRIIGEYFPYQLSEEELNEIIKE